MHVSPHNTEMQPDTRKDKTDIINNDHAGGRAEAASDDDVQRGVYREGQVVLGRAHLCILSDIRLTAFWLSRWRSRNLQPPGDSEGRERVGEI